MHAGRHMYLARSPAHKPSFHFPPYLLINALQVMWLPSSNYTQWARWEADDLSPALITFSIRNGNKACAANSNPTQILVNGAFYLAAGFAGTVCWHDP